MKKTIFITLLTSVLLLTPTAVKAEDEVSKAGQELITLTANVASTYTVKFPRSVNVTQDEVSFNVDVKGELSSMEKVVLTLPEKVELTETAYNANNARKVEIQVANTKSDFVMEDLDVDNYNEEAGRTTVTLTHEKINAGKWSGGLFMTIGIEDRYAVGERDSE